MRRFRWLKLAVIIALLGGGRAVFAQSFSDMNMRLFEDLSKGEFERAPTSPFATMGMSMADDLTIEDLILNGIVSNPSNAYALISGYLVREGDRIAGYRVEKIEKEQVVLRRLDEVFILILGGM